MSENDIPVQDREVAILRHMLGFYLRHQQPGYRNFYASTVGTNEYDILRNLERAGDVEEIPAPHTDTSMAWFQATRQGKRRMGIGDSEQ